LTRFRFTGKAPQSIRAAIQVHEQPEWIDTNWERQPVWTEPPESADGADWGFCARMGATTDVPLRCYTAEEAVQMIDRVAPYQEQYRREIGVGLVYASDEFYLLCEREMPPEAWYDDYPQYSNGVGMTREFLDAWAYEQQFLPGQFAQSIHVALVCGTLISTTMQQVVARLNRIAGLDMHLLPVINTFFGETVTVSGLLTGQDIIPALRASGGSQALLPRVMFDHQGGQTLDAYSPQQIEEETGVEIILVNDASELVHWAQQQSASTYLDSSDIAA
jgi:NifB/MoaA-like Fe-S oxidoreductase